MSAGVGCFGSPIERLIGRLAPIRRDAGVQRTQPFERVGLQEPQQRIHAGIGEPEEDRL